MTKANTEVRMKMKMFSTIFIIFGLVSLLCGFPIEEENSQSNGPENLQTEASEKRMLDAVVDEKLERLVDAEALQRRFQVEDSSAPRPHQLFDDESAEEKAKAEKVLQNKREDALSLASQQWESDEGTEEAEEFEHNTGESEPSLPRPHWESEDEPEEEAEAEEFQHNTGESEPSPPRLQWESQDEPEKGDLVPIDAAHDFASPPRG